MSYRNETDFPDEELMVILHFTDPDDFLSRPGEIVIKNRTKDDPYGTYVRIGGNGLPTITIYKEKDDTDYHLVLYLAHEFRHTWQWDFCSFLYDVRNSRIAKMAEQIQENDAHAYDLAMLRIWDINEWNWNTLRDRKKKYLMTLMC
jgi:hypothetical protein